MWIVDQPERDDPTQTTAVAPARTHTASTSSCQHLPSWVVTSGSGRIIRRRLPYSYSIYQAGTNQGDHRLFELKTSMSQESTVYLSVRQVDLATRKRQRCFERINLLAPAAWFGDQTDAGIWVHADSSG
jgi:hypothetical protein